jgi:transcriptional antiterminator NusG
MSKRWYVVHAYSGFEVGAARSSSASRAGMQDFFGQILVPSKKSSK